MRKTNFSDIRLDKLMCEFRDRIRQKRIELKTKDLPLYGFPGKYRSDCCSYKSSLAPPAKPLIGTSELHRDIYELHDFLQYDGNSFIENAYRCILKRQPDSQAYHFYLRNLLRGNMTKVEILGHLRYSREGRARGIKIKGLFWMFHALKLKIVLFSVFFGRLVKKSINDHFMSDIQSDSHNVKSELAYLKDKFQQIERLAEEQATKVSQELSEFRRLTVGLVDHSAIDQLEKVLKNEQSKLFQLLTDQETVLDELQRYLQENQMEFAQLRRQINPLLVEKKKHALSGPIDGEFFEGQFDYLGFENRLRGSEDMVREHHRAYIEYFQGKDVVLDIGCGRGEFLELLREAGIGGEGVDFNPDMVQHCREKGLQVSEADALTYLQSLPDNSLGAVFCAQLVEHLTTEDMLALIKATHQKLRTGGVLIVETLNPESLLVTYRWFWIDPTHIRLVHPETLKFLFESAGFSEVVHRVLPPPEGPILLPPLKDGSFAQDELANFNQATQYLNQLLYAGFDYAVIGSK